MKRYIVLYVCAALVFFPLDLLWLGVVARNFYRSRLGQLLLDQPRWGVALLFYAFYIVGVVVFAMAPALASGSWRTAALYGALFGCLAYATYDLTNLATLRGYPASLALVDIVWGTVLTALAAALGLVIARSVADLSPTG